jgi:hypothetical protein
VSGAEPDLNEQRLRLLNGAERSWLTLPASGEELPPELTVAIDTFDAGEREAAKAATHWLKHNAGRHYDTARTRLLVADGRVLGFYALASAQVKLRGTDRQQSFAGVEHSIPAALIAWIAKAQDAAIEGREILLHAAATARRATEHQATAVLVVDPFDDDTSQMWQERFGFRASAGRHSKRLWVSLALED